MLEKGAVVSASSASGGRTWGSGGMGGMSGTGGWNALPRGYFAYRLPVGPGPDSHLYGYALFDPEEPRTVVAEPLGEITSTPVIPGGQFEDLGDGIGIPVYEAGLGEVRGNGTIQGPGSYGRYERATFTAAPAPGFRFAGWLGALAGQPATVTLRMLENVELAAGFEMDLADDDGDGLTNHDEVVVHQTNPYERDTDGDGFLDGCEVLAGTSPLDGNDRPALVAEARTAVEFAFPSALGRSYRIEESADLAHWTVAESGIAGTGARIARFYSTRHAPRRHFRVAEEQEAP